MLSAWKDGRGILQLIESSGPTNLTSSQIEQRMLYLDCPPSYRNGEALSNAPLAVSGRTERQTSATPIQREEGNPGCGQASQAALARRHDELHETHQAPLLCGPGSSSAVGQPDHDRCLYLNEARS